ncbi:MULTISPECIES: UL36 very large tegument protein [Streptomyces]|uniref:UL36 very large tegument protein n=1 Tax=Streptomyces venezuelae TaxID=54571 RepID=A0A5P2AN75_STRVZ|nr:UL36 very large tegument protein [Streptomyces venezuelae]QES18990.1 UL36 very large tegument protein [Streptomyces venezuelae]
MTVHQLPVEVANFAQWLTELASRLRPDAGWYGVFAERDPEGLRACFDGAEILPWDVVESLLQDAGEQADGPLAGRGRALHAAAATAHDRRPGGAAALAERRDLMEHERRYAESRARELGDRLRAAAGTAEAAGLESDLAWIRDDHARAAARVTELTARLARLGGTAGAAPAPAAPPSAKRRPRGARYAWLEESAEGATPAVAVPALPTGGAAPRGARFGGGGESGAAAAQAPAPSGETAPAQAVRAAANAVYALQRLRAQGRSGEAHALLCEALTGPPDRLPALAAELHRAGLHADWSTLLWEAASLPPGRLAAVAGVLADAGRAADCDQLLRQGVARPVEELAGACAALRADGHDREAHALLTAFVRVRTPEDAARLAVADPRGLVPRLIGAARAVSAARERDLLHALRVAGLAGLAGA